MNLLSIDELSTQLDIKFAPLEPVVAGFRLPPRSLDRAAIRTLIEVLGVTPPQRFSELISTYDFGNFTLGPIVFCGTGDYVGELIRLNTEVRWWGQDERPQNLILIANSDPYAFLMDCRTSRVSAFDQEQTWRGRGDIARDFESFVRAAGTAMLARSSVADRDALATAVARQAGADDFYWRSLAR